MANVIKDIPTTTAGDPEILPWATQGTTLEPTPGQESTGWQPQASAGPPDYRLENYARLNQSKLNARGVQTGLFLECAAASIRLFGFAAGVNQRRITISGVNFDVIDAVSLASVRDAFIAAINSNPVTSVLVTASSAGSGGGAQFLALIDNAPGTVFSAAPSLAVAVLAGAGTITVPSPATTPIVREDVAGMAADLVIGAETADDDGNAIHDARIVWRKAKGSFRAGTFTGVAANDSVTGIGSIAMGSDPTASGTDSVALGSLSVAGATNAFAAMGADVAGSRSVGIGTDVVITAAGTNAVAAGNSVLASANATIAIGNSATSSAADAIALGTGSTATATNAFAAAGAVASGTNSIAIGNSVEASGSRGAFASGRSDGGTLSATGEGSRAHGYASTGSTITATGDGAMASGHAGNVATITATANGALAHGYNSNAVVNAPLTASGVNAQAYGSGSLASGDYSHASGYGAKATNRGESAEAATSFINGALGLQVGSSQKGSFHVTLRTTDATADQVLTPGAGATTFTPLADTVYMCDASVIGKKEGADDSYASWSFKFTLAYVAGVLTVKRIVAVNGAAGTLLNVLAGAAMVHFDDGATAGAAWALNIDTNAGNVRFRVTGAVGTNIRWSARCDYVAVGQQP